MRYAAEHKARTRAQVLSQAARVLQVEGPHGVGVAKVMARAGLTHGGFYAHFGSRDEMVAEAMGQAFRASAERFDEAVRGKPPREALVDYIDLYLSSCHLEVGESGCPLPALAGDAARLGGAARDRYSAGVARHRADLRTLFERAGLPTSETLIASTLAELVGAVALARTVADAEESLAVLAHSRAALTARLGLDAPAAGAQPSVDQGSQEAAASV